MNMKKLITLLFMLPLLVFGQANKIDTTIYVSNYTSYFSKSHKNPIILTYKLYKGGGDCSRAGFRFKNDLPISCQTDAEYLKSGYDKGHLANAEDFANNCMYDELTFRYYNCVPQTKELNRGIWKQQETTIRAMSQTDSLLIFCFNDFSGCNKPQNSLHVPTYCVKGVKSLSTGKWVSIMLYTNTSKPEGKQITPEEFKAKFGIDINQY